MMHHFDIKIAEEYGVYGAIFLENIRYWIEKNKANNHNFFDGCYWVYNSGTAFKKLFPYLSDSQIKLTLNKLSEKGAIKKGNYNTNKYDRTIWYSIVIDLEGKNNKCISQKQPMEKSETANGKVRNDEPIPVNKPCNKPVNKNTKKNDFAFLEDESTSTKKIKTCYSFEEFYNDYDKKVSKVKAEKKYKSINESDRQLIKDTIKKYIESTPDKKYRKDPTTYLNNETWNDEIVSEPVKPKPAHLMTEQEHSDAFFVEAIQREVANRTGYQMTDDEMFERSVEHPDEGFTEEQKAYHRKEYYGNRNN